MNNAYMALNIGCDRFDYATFMKNNSIVVKMIDKLSADGEFKREVKQANKDT